MAIQISSQSTEFVKEVVDKLNSMTGAKQRVTFLYHAKSSGLVECQNHTIGKLWWDFGSKL